MDLEQKAGTWEDPGFVVPLPPSSEDLSRLVRRAFALKKYTPPALPHVVRALMQLSAQDDVDFRKVARVIESDAVVAGHVLRAANSPVYRRAELVRSIEQAVAQRGLVLVREILSLVALDTAVMRRPEYQAELLEIRDRGLLMSRIVPRVAQVGAVANEWLPIAALFSDAGLSASMMLIGAVYDPEVPPLAGVWRELFRIHHHTSYYMAQLWELPEPVPSLVRAHHGPTDLPGVDPAAVAALVVADALAGESVRRAREDPPCVPDFDDERMFEQALARLGIDLPELDAMREEADEILARLHKEP